MKFETRIVSGSKLEKKEQDELVGMIPVEDGRYFVPRVNEEEIKTKLDKLYGALNGRVIKNSEGVEVTIHVAREQFTNSSEEVWYVTFEYEYRGKVINRPYPQTSSYIQLNISPNTSKITVGMAQLESEILKGKNVYPQFMSLLGENFPDDVDLESQIGHEKTRDSILNAEQEYRRGGIDIETLKNIILESHLIKARVAGGFNYFELTFKPNPASGQTTLELIVRKIDGTDQPKLVILGL